MLLRLSTDEFWFSLADSDILFWLQGVNVGLRMDVRIDEIDVCPVQIQGPKSLALMTDLVGDRVRGIPYYGLLEAEIAGCSVVVSQSGFSGEKGYEIYLRDATLHAEKLWHAVLEAGKAHQLAVIAPGHQRRIQAGILSWARTWTRKPCRSSATWGTRFRAGSRATTSARQRSSACGTRSPPGGRRSRWCWWG